jgi:hypothetical protein
VRFPKEGADVLIVFLPVCGCLRSIRSHKSTSLIGTELCNYAYTGLDPLGMTYSNRLN